MKGLTFIGAFDAAIYGPRHLFSPVWVSSYVEPCGQHICVITLVPGVAGGGPGGGSGAYTGEVGGSGGDDGGETGGGGDGAAAHVAAQPSDV